MACRSPSRRSKRSARCEAAASRWSARVTSSSMTSGSIGSFRGPFGQREASAGTRQDDLCPLLFRALRHLERQGGVCQHARDEDAFSF